MPTSTGAVADHRLPLRATEVEAFAQAVGGGGGGFRSRRQGRASKIPAEWIAAVGRDLTAHRGSFDGDRGRTSAAIRARAGARDERRAGQCRQDGRLHRVDRSESGQSDRFAARSGQRPECGQSGLPTDSGCESRLQRARRFEFRGCHSEGEDARLLGLAERRDGQALPLAGARPRTIWNPGATARAYDGTVGIIAAADRALYTKAIRRTRSSPCSRATPESHAHDLVRDYWQSQRPEKGAAFEAFWETFAARRGDGRERRCPPLRETLRSDFVQQAPGCASGAPARWKLCSVPIRPLAMASMRITAGCRKRQSQSRG